MTPFRAKSVLKDRNPPWSSHPSNHLKVFPRHFGQIWSGVSWSLSKGIGTILDWSRSVGSHRYFLSHQVFELMWYCSSKIRGGDGVMQSKRGSLQGKKWLKRSWTSPKYIGASTAQPYDRIIGPAKAKRVTTASTILPRLHAKKATITILPCNQKLTEDRTKC